MKQDDDGLFPEQRFFNRLVDWGEIALDKGIAQMWFSWIEWIGLTAILFVAFEKTKSIIALIAGILSVIALFFVALAALRKIFASQIQSNVSNKWLVLLSIVLVFAGPVLAFSLITAILQAANA